MSIAGSMELNGALTDKKEAILALWTERTLDSYISSGFFKHAKDPFANPVGVNIASGLKALLDLVIEDAALDAYQQPLDQVVRIRAVQDFTPSQAVAPFLELKWVIKQIFSGSKDTKPLLAQLDILDCRIDRMALAAFDIYSTCRELLYQNRIRELKSGTALLTDAGCPSAILRADLRETNTDH